MDNEDNLGGINRSNAAYDDLDPSHHPAMAMNLSLYSVAAFLIMDTDGNRVMAKYYRPKHNPLTTPLPDTKQLVNLKEQKAFEKGLWEKTKKPGGTC
jgi:coatomer subunit zeta